MQCHYQLNKLGRLGLKNRNRIKVNSKSHIAVIVIRLMSASKSDEKIRFRIKSDFVYYKNLTIFDYFMKFYLKSLRLFICHIQMRTTWLRLFIATRDCIDTAITHWHISQNKIGQDLTQRPLNSTTLLLSITPRLNFLKSVLNYWALHPTF